MLHLKSVLLAGVLLYGGGKYTINGKIEGDFNGKVYLSAAEGFTPVKIDSAIVKNGKFTFKGGVKIPDLYFISLEDKKGQMLFFLENSKLNVTLPADSVWKGQVKGSGVHDQYVKYNQEEGQFTAKLDEISKALRALNKNKEASEAERSKLMEEYRTVNKADMDYIKNYIAANPKSVLTPFLLQSKYSLYRFTELDSVVNNLDKSVMTTNGAKYITNYISVKKKTDVGQPLTDFAFPDSTGKVIALSSVVKQHKYVLLDFWASWCGPCRAEMPQVKEIYAKYKSQGFEIFAVSLDASAAPWKKAMQEFNMQWPSVSDLKGWNCEAGKLYGVTGVPYNVLIDQQGTIVAKNLHGNGLDAKLKELLK